MKTQIAVHGAAGRMGRRLCELARGMDGLQLVEAVDHPDHPLIGRPLSESGDVTLTDSLTDAAEVIIDFGSPESTRRALRHSLETGQALVIGTTGLAADDDAAIDQAGSRIAVLQASNFSLVVNVLHQLAAHAAKLLGDEYDIELLEAHHRFKKDAPSGTAHALARTLCRAAGRDPDRDVRFDRHGDDVPRQAREITVQTLRLGDHPGEHTIYFATLGERLELKHVSTSRDSYAVGALRAAAWLADQPPKRYRMSDMLEFGDG